MRAAVRVRRVTLGWMAPMARPVAVLGARPAGVPTLITAAMGTTGRLAGECGWRCLKGLRANGLKCGSMAGRRGKVALPVCRVKVGRVKAAWFIARPPEPMGGPVRRVSLGWLGLLGS